MRKIAAGIIKMPARPKPKGLTSSDLIDPSTGAFVGADIIMGRSLGGSRAGRAESMASAMGQDVPHVISNPKTNFWGHSLAGIGAGAGIGAVTGALLGSLDENQASERARDGAVGGAILGGLAGTVLSLVKRRMEMSRIGRDFDKHEGDITPTARKANLLGFSPSHARGREEGFRAMMGGNRNMRGSVTDIASSFVPGGSFITAPATPFIANNSNEKMSEIARRDGGYGFQANMEKF